MPVLPKHLRRTKAVLRMVHERRQKRDGPKKALPLFGLAWG